MKILKRTMQCSIAFFMAICMNCQLAMAQSSDLKFFNLRGPVKTAQDISLFGASDTDFMFSASGEWSNPSKYDNSFANKKTVVKRDAEGKITSFNGKTYSWNGSVVTGYTSKEGTYKTEVTYSYNANGQIISETTNFENTDPKAKRSNFDEPYKKVTVKTYSNIVVDSNGNWVSRSVKIDETEYRPSGNNSYSWSTTQKRVLTYY